MTDPIDTARVLVAGEALVDEVLAPDGSRVEAAPGGGPLNIAVTLARLGVPTDLLTSFGSDGYGERVAAHLERSGVRLYPGSRGRTRTSVARARLDHRHQATYDFDLHWDPPAAVPAPGCAAVHVGSLGTVVAPGAARVHELVRRANHEAIVVSYDPNVRPAVLDAVVDPWAAVRDLAAAATLVKLSDEDAAYLRPGSSEDAVLDELLRGDRTRLAVLTRGQHGLRLATREHRVVVPAVPVDVVDTVGAGDACMGGLLAALFLGGRLDEASLQRLEAADLEQVGAVASQVAALTCSRRGADPPARDDLPADAFAPRS